MSRIRSVPEDDWGSFAPGVLDEITSSLGAFSVWVDPAGENITFQRADGFTITATLDDERGGSRVALYQRILDRIVCCLCHDLMIEGETGRCGSCEARMVLELIGLRRELAA